MSIKKYQKKPIVVEAVQIIWENIETLREFAPAETVEISVVMGEFTEKIEDGLLSIIVNTLEGKMLGYEGDYLIKGIKGEYYPCKPDIFEATYEEVD